MNPVDPKTPEEWQEAVNLAEFYLTLDSCKQYGLVTFEPEIQVDRCAQIITMGKEIGVVPNISDETLTRFLAPWIRR